MLRFVAFDLFLFMFLNINKKFVEVRYDVYGKSVCLIVRIVLLTKDLCFIVEPVAGLEPATYALRMRCSTN